MKNFRKRCLLGGGAIVFLLLASFSLRCFPTQAALSTAEGKRDTGPRLSNSAMEASAALTALPLQFEKNQGQWPTAIQFAARGQSYQVGITAQEAIMTFASQTATPSRNKRESLVLRLHLRHAQPSAVVEGVTPLAARTNYFLGKNSSQWHTDIPTYEKVRVREVYPGIDMLYYGTPKHLEYDFDVAPGADPTRIEFALQGATPWHLTAEGDLVSKIGQDELRQKKPVAYQLINGSRQKVEVRYRLTRRNTVQFTLGHYDETQPLVIDPVITYSTLWGGRYSEGATLIRTDAAGNLYVLGDTQSDDFPLRNPAQKSKSEAPIALCATQGGCPDVFISKFDPTGRQLLFSTYLGGTYIENGLGMAVDAEGNVYVTGVTYSGDFPTTPGCFQAERKGASTVGRDVFVTKLNATGSVLLYSTYLGKTQRMGENSHMIFDNSLSPLVY